MAIGLLIFDCDGVLIDSEPHFAWSMAEALAQHSIQTDAATVHAMFTGLGHVEARALARETWGAVDMDAVYASMNEMLFPRFATDLREMAGISDVMRQFAGVPRCVASNSSHERLRKSLGLLPLHAEFAPHVYSMEDVPLGKPAPDLPLHCLARLGVAAAEAVMIDDSAHGMTAARAAGVYAIGFVDPNDPRRDRIEVLGAAGAQAIATGTDELGRILQQLHEG